MGRSDLVTPVATTHGDEPELGVDHRGTDGVGHLLRALHAQRERTRGDRWSHLTGLVCVYLVRCAGGDPSQPDVALEVTHHHERLEAGALTGGGLLLHGHHLEDLVLQSEGGVELGRLSG